MKCSRPGRHEGRIKGEELVEPVTIIESNIVDDGTGLYRIVGALVKAGIRTSAVTFRAAV